MGRFRNVRTSVDKVARILAGTRKAQMPIQLLWENSIKVLKSNINFWG
jgi:hypothetical protein